jgi:hypothetical protein
MPAGQTHGQADTGRFARSRSITSSAQLRAEVLAHSATARSASGRT